MRPLSPSTPASSGNARREEQLHFLLWFRSPELEQEFVKTRVREGRFFMTSFLVMVRARSRPAYGLKITSRLTAAPRAWALARARCLDPCCSPC